MNWVKSMAWIMKPIGSPPQDLYAYVSRRVKIKSVRPTVRLPRGVKRISLPKLKKELDRLFSLFIRQRDSDPHTGLGKCATCDHVAHWKTMDCGHYCPRQDLATRWDERNCCLQDKSCNGFRGGCQELMAAYIDLKYGAGTAENLRAQARQPFRLNRQWLEAKINYYQGLIHE